VTTSNPKKIRFWGLRLLPPFRILTGSSIKMQLPVVSFQLKKTWSDSRSD
jgi:hypothetical protein